MVQDELTYTKKDPCIYGYARVKKKTMYSLYAIHESRLLRQARPKGQYVDLTRRDLRKLLPHKCLISYHILIKIVNYKTGYNLIFSSNICFPFSVSMGKMAVHARKRNLVRLAPSFISMADCSLQ